MSFDNFKMLDNFILFNLSFSFSLKYLLQCDNTRMCFITKKIHTIQMKVKIHLYQPSTPPLSTTQSSPRITIVFSLVFRLLEISMLPICITYMFLSCKYIIFGRIKPVHIIPKLTFFHCTAYLLFIYRDLACFLSCLVWLYHIRFVTPQVTFKLSLICDHCKQC